MASGDHEQMGGSLCVDVAEDNCIVALRNYIRGDITIDNSTEKTFCSHQVVTGFWILDSAIALATASAAIPAVSKRRTVELKRTGVKNPSTISWRSSSASPPSGPRAITSGKTGSTASSVRPADASSSNRVPDGAAAMARLTGADG